MSEVLVSRKQQDSWMIEIPAEMAEQMNVAVGSVAVLHAKEGAIEIEVLTASDEIKRSARRVFDKYQGAFAEMKRLGD